MADTLVRQSPPQGGQGPLSVRYLSFTAAMGLSQLGDAAWYVALTWTLVRDVSPATAGAVLALASLPRLAGLLGGGVLADRRGPRAVMVTTDVLRAAVMLAAALYIRLANPSAVSLVVAAAALAFLSAFFVPASGAVKPLLLADEHLVRGNALYVLGLRGGTAAGGPLGAWLIAFGGVPLVALVNAVSYLVSATASWRVRFVREPAAAAAAKAAGQTPAERPPFKRQLTEGLRYVAGQHRILMVIVVIGLTELSCAPPVNIGLVLLSDRLGSSAGGAGLLLTAYTVGAVGSSLATMAWPPGRRGGLSLMLGTFGAAVCLACFGLVTSLGLGLVLYVALGLVAGRFSVVLMSMIQRWSDPGMRGRVMSVVSIVIFGAAPLANLVVGSMIQALGFGPAMGVFAALALTATVVTAATPALRSARLD